MEPIFLDFHIHTSDDPENLNESYSLEILISKVEKIAGGSNYLISLTDHNVINKPVYLKAADKIENILLGVELHIRNYDSEPPYHCHMLFNLENIDEKSIDDINSKLYELYPNKVVSKTDTSIPKLENIMNTFDEYEFVLLPHGGQNHSTFDISIPDGVQFDKTLHRSIYYNLIDGFTARSNKSLGKTHEYFKRLGINDFVNLVTATDNYNPKDYPGCKAGRDASDFTPTWMLANPTFNGLRLSLSESARLVYGEKPDSWAEYIQHVLLKNDNTDINVNLTPGLNVVIGDSSSGKSLFVDSVYREIAGELNDSQYIKTPFNIQNIQVTNPTGQHPHYFDQSYISRICDPKDKENNIDDISMLKSIFPPDSEEKQKISNGLSVLGSELTRLILSVKEIEAIQESLLRIPKLSSLIVTEEIKDNPLKSVLPEDSIIESIQYTGADYERDIKILNDINEFLTKNPLVSHDDSLIIKLKDELNESLEHSKIERSIREIIIKHEKEIDSAQEEDDRETATKRQQFEKLLELVKKYIKYEKIFNEALEEISKFKIIIKTKEIVSMGHKLFIDNEFELTKEKFLEKVNGMLKPEYVINKYDDISPEALFQSKFRKREPKVRDYNDFESRIKTKFEGMNKKKYRIITNEGKDFDDLSAGWKTSVILDLILGWDDDNAPLIIDQPEDNLATRYINHGLLKAIKECKTKKQIILVSHNATIPMLGDAQNVIMCRNNNNSITIKSNPLEGYIDNVSVVDLIAKTTDGGKASIKKRVKKYNLKDYKEADNEVTI